MLDLYSLYKNDYIFWGLFLVTVWLMYLSFRDLSSAKAASGKK